MYSISTEYKEQIEKTLRNFSYLKINLGIVEPDASTGLSISDNGSLFISDVEDVNVGTLVEKRYMTMEHNRFILDGKGLLPPEIGDETPYYQGYIGSTISDESGSFSSYPKITINFSDYFSFIGLTFRFDKILNSYPTELRVVAYNDTTIVYDSTVNPTSYDFILNDAIPSTGTCNKIELIYKSTFPVKRRACLDYIMFGVVKSFDESVLSDSTWNRKMDILSTVLPTNEFSFTIFDLEKEYNPDNADGIWKFIEEKQPVSFEYGYELDNGNIEWITGGNMLTTGDITVDTSSVISKATFNANSILNQLTDIYYRGTYNPNGNTYYDIALDIFEFANLPLLPNGDTPYYIDPVLQNYTTTIPIDEVPINQALQILANAGFCSLYVDRTGKINLKSFNPVLSDFKFDFSNMTSTPTISKIPELLNVYTTYDVPSINQTVEELIKVDVISQTATEYRITYDSATNITYSITGLTVTGTPEHYAKSTVITLTGTGSIIIYGNKINKITSSLTYDVGLTGYTCSVTNELIDSEEMAYIFAQRVAMITSLRNTYYFDNRGYPELDMFDYITFDSLFTNGLNAYITSLEIKYNGSLSSKATILSEEVI